MTVPSTIQPSFARDHSQFLAEVPRGVNLAAIEPTIDG